MRKVKDKQRRKRSRKTRERSDSWGGRIIIGRKHKKGEEVRNPQPRVHEKEESGKDAKRKTKSARQTLQKTQFLTNSSQIGHHEEKKGVNGGKPQ